MNRGQLRTEVRRILQEPAETSSSLWVDDELNDYLNEAAQVITAQVQPIQAVELVASVAGQQEYLLPSHVKEIFAVSYQQGNNLLPLNPTNPHEATQNTPFRGTPNLFYVRAFSPHIAGRATSGAMTLTPADPQDSTSHRLMLGLLACPSASSQQIVIQYYAEHYLMVNDAQAPVIPYESQRALIAYAVAIAKQKEQAYAEIQQVYMPMFKDFLEQLQKKMISRGIQARGRHKVYVPGEGPRMHGTDMVQLPWTSGT